MIYNFIRLVLLIFLNGIVQYGSFVVGSTVGQELGPSALIAPIAQLGTAYQYVRGVQGTVEASKRAATIAVLLSSSAAVLETDIATNGAMAALNVAFNSCCRIKLVKIKLLSSS